MLPDELCIHTSLTFLNTMTNLTDNQEAEVVIIGGSYSGMSAAMALGRALRSVLIIDAGAPCNRFAPHAHNLLGSDGTPPMEIHAEARKQLLQYSTVRITEDTVINVTKEAPGFVIHTASAKHYKAQKLLLATGLKDELPPIPGLQACWGISAIHCPYCHGYEFKGGKTALLATSSEALHMISLLKQWTRELSVFTQDGFRFNKAALDFLQSQAIPVITDKIISLVHENGSLREVQLENDEGKPATMPLDVLYVMPKIQQSLDLQQSLGYKLTAAGHIEVDQGGHSSVQGLYAAGDNSSRFRSLSYSLATGMAAGAMINFDLVNEKRPLPDIQ